MTVIAVGMVKDENDIIEPVLRHLVAEGVDRVILYDNLSTDGTFDTLERLHREGLPLVVLEDTEVGYYQSRKTSRLAQLAFEQGADWVLPFDADEVWYSPGSTIAEALGSVPDDVQVLKAAGWDHLVREGGHEFESTEGDGIDCSVCHEYSDATLHEVGPFSPWRREQTQPMVKVAFRAHPNPLVDMGNHGVTLPGTQGRDTTGVLAYRHFQYRSLAQMTRKLRQGRAAYEATDLRPDQGLHWRAGGLKTDEELARDWALLCSEEGLVFDPAPLRVAVS